MTKYIKGQEILDNWNIRDFQLLDYVRRGLRLYKTNTGQIFECPPKYNLKTKLENLDRWIANMEHPDFPDNLYYWEKERVSYDDRWILLDEMKQDRAKIMGKLDSIQLEIDINDRCSWYYCEFPDSDQEALVLINSVAESLFLETDVMEIFGPPKKGSKLKVLGISKQVKLRYDQMCREKCRDIAKKLWDKDPTITIADMVYENELQTYTLKQNGEMYTGRTIRGWINDLCPDRSPGRRPNKNKTI